MLNWDAEFKNKKIQRRNGWTEALQGPHLHAQVRCQYRTETMRQTESCG